LKKNCDILQIGAKCNFSTYINPVRDISENATRINELTSNGELLYHGRKVQAVSMRAALECLNN